jgi:hypothetical protein
MSRKGMVLFQEKTYRLVKLSPGKYEVIRILDDLRVGTFDTVPRLRVMPEGVDAEFLRELALAAIKEAKISWTSLPSQEEESRRLRPSSPSPAVAPVARKIFA